MVFWGTLQVVTRRGLGETTRKTLISCLTAGMLLCVPGTPPRAAPPAAQNGFPQVLSASGEVSCGQFIEDQRADNMALTNLFVMWVWNFLIDHHEFVDVKPGKASDRVDLPGQATVLLFLERFCEHNPLSNVYDGTVALLQSRRRSGLISTQAVITGRIRVRKTMRRPIGSRPASIRLLLAS